MAWYDKLPAGMTNGQVRAALTKVMHNMFDGKENFNEGGFPTIGFCRSPAQCGRLVYQQWFALYDIACVPAVRASDNSSVLDRCSAALDLAEGVGWQTLPQGSSLGRLKTRFTQTE